MFEIHNSQLSFGDYGKNIRFNYYVIWNEYLILQYCNQAASCQPGKAADLLKQKNS
jgi:hypothetical protein